MKRNKLKAKIIEKGLTVESFAKAIGMERTKLYRKLNSFEKITIGEAIKMKAVLEMSNEEAIDIFLT
jgi:plasmid maintenance system antidote protein VapI